MNNTILVTDEKLSNDVQFQDFLKNNPGYSTLKIRASAANEAYPISGVRIVVTKKIGNYDVIFYEGETDSSGMINNIVLPSPRAIQNDLEIPQFTSYSLQASSEKDDFYQTFEVSVCCGITVIQYINITPIGTGGRDGD